MHHYQQGGATKTVLVRDRPLIATARRSEVLPCIAIHRTRRDTPRRTYITTDRTGPQQPCWYNEVPCSRAGTRVCALWPTTCGTSWHPQVAKDRGGYEPISMVLHCLRDNSDNSIRVSTYISIFCWWCSWMLLVLYLKMLYIADAAMDVAAGIFSSVFVILFILVLSFLYLLFVYYCW